MRAISLAAPLVAAALLLTIVPTASAYTCTDVGSNARVCDIQDDGVPDLVWFFVQGQASGSLLAYHDGVVTSTGMGYTTYGALGFHGGGLSAGCYDPNQDLDCDYGSVNWGSTDVGYLAVEKYGDNLRLCRWSLPDYGCTQVL